MPVLLDLALILSEHAQAGVTPQPDVGISQHLVQDTSTLFLSPQSKQNHQLATGCVYGLVELQLPAECALAHALMSPCLYCVQRKQHASRPGELS